jgi:hypothetical protein
MRGAPIIVALFLLANVNLAWAKEHAVRSPSGRRIYNPDETFAEVLDQDSRRFIVEAAVGAGPEGHLAMGLGYLFKDLPGLAVYASVGLEVNPAVHYTLSARWVFNLAGWRPYIAAGYLLNQLTAVETLSHNLYVEAGYSWKLEHTYRLTAGVGLRRLLHVHVLEESELRAPDTDPEFLEEQLGNIDPWLPTIALRFSRAF